MNRNQLFYEASDLTCRSHYDDLRNDFVTSGIDLPEITKSRGLIYDDGTTTWVDKAAFCPTGVALGSPLPNLVFSETLFEIANLFAKRVEPLLSPGPPTFSFVPMHSYHVTIVNFTHFDCVNSKDEIVTLNINVLNKVQEYFYRKIHPAPSIKFHGLILTRAGRLIVPGYAANPTPFLIRSDLANLIPQFRTKLPNTLHIKLGHVLQCLRPSNQYSCQKLVEELGRRVASTLLFKDIFTPEETFKGVFL